MKFPRYPDDLIEAARTWEGWRVQKVKRGWMLYPKDKRFGPITLHKTPSDNRAIKNTLSRLKRAGAPL